MKYLAILHGGPHDGTGYDVDPAPGGGPPRDVKTVVGRDFSYGVGMYAAGEDVPVIENGYDVHRYALERTSGRVAYYRHVPPRLPAVEGVL